MTLARYDLYALSGTRVIRMAGGTSWLTGLEDNLPKRVPPCKSRADTLRAATKSLAAPGFRLHVLPRCMTLPKVLAGRKERSMGRIIGSVIAGYVAMFAVVFMLMSLAWVALGAGGSFQPGSWNVSWTWILVTVVVGLVAAIAGGYLCALIARDPRGPKWLVGVVVVLGILMAIPVITGGGDVAAAGPRPETMPMFDAMSNAIQPVWVALLNPLLGAVGVLIGSFR